MKTSRWTIFFIILITWVTIWLSLPTAYPLNINLGPIHQKLIVQRPVINLPPVIHNLGGNLRLRTGLDIQGGSQLVFEANMQDIAPSDRVAALEATKQNIENRINSFGVSEPTVQTAQAGDQYRLNVELPGVQDIDQAIQLIGQTAQLEFYKPTEATDSALPFEPSGLTGKNLVRAYPEFDPNTGSPIVRIEFDPEGADLFADLTTQYVGQQIIIVLDGVPVSDPVVNEPIVGGTAVISSSDFTAEATKQLSIQLNAGALPVPISLVRQQNIGATLGTESVTQSITAGLIGLGLVMLFMLIYYGQLGFISVLGLVLYGLITIALYKIIGVTLTLPGIAGFILSVGMAVDANILVFERLKEEMAQKRPFGLALELAFGRAWDSIRDANICTIVTAIILYSTTTGPVKGFAVTLGLGIAISLFTGIFVTRNLIRVSYRPKPINNTKK